MKTIVIPQFYRGPSGQKGLYNRQEVGLARAFAALGCRAVVLYPEPGAKAPRIETPEPNVKICYMPAVAFGVQAFYKSWQILLDEHADAVHVMGDNSLGVPGLYRFCQKHGNIILDGKADTYKAAAGSSTEENESSEKLSLGAAFYKHLMSGVSQMLPFVIGGGIMIALAFLIDNILGVPKDQLSNLGTYHQAAAYFKTIGNAAFGFMLPILAGYIAYSIAEKPGLVAGFVAGAIASSGAAWGNLEGTPSGFLGALVGGFLAGWLVNLVKKACAGLPRSLEGIKSILLYPLLGVFLTGFAMLFVNIPMAAINTGLNNFLGGLQGASAVLLGAILGGMMAIDMGGPFNKAAYVFGTGTLAASVASGGSVAMASVMAGGMVPPLAVFVATLLFKNKFTEEERNSGLTNIIMGLSFITEGAIPFGAADPARAIPSFVVGSAVAGGLVGAFGIKLMAPHGGIFVIALTSAPILYLIFVIIGAIVAGVLFGALKKEK